MVYRNMNMYEMLDFIQEKTLICFGAGQLLRSICDSYSDVSFFCRVDFIADNNEDMQHFQYNGAKKPVHTIDFCLKHADKKPAILVTVADCIDVLEQLETIPELRDCVCFVYIFLNDYVKKYDLPKDRAKNESLRIPKTTHYCWFGGKPIRDDFARYIETWRQFCPDYEIVRWDESNYDYKKNEYMYDAYKQLKWGFVSDFARLDIIYTHGGVYLDTDVELIRNIDDLLCDDAYCGFSRAGGRVNNGLGFGAVAGFPLILEQMKMYEKLVFLNTDGSINYTSGSTYQTEFFRQKGLVFNNTLQNIQGVTIYPSDVLDPFNVRTQTCSITGNTYSIHHSSNTWFDDARHLKLNILFEKYRQVAYVRDGFVDQVKRDE